jgi:hypothetical protein
MPVPSPIVGFGAGTQALMNPAIAKILNICFI